MEPAGCYNKNSGKAHCLLFFYQAAHLLCAPLSKTGYPRIYCFTAPVCAGLHNNARQGVRPLTDRQEKMNQVVLSHVSYAYQHGVVLEDISLEIAAGEFVVIVGPNGAGKTTLLKLVAGLIQPTLGTVTISGKSVKEACRSAMMGYIPQNYGRNAAGFPATVEEVVALGLIGAKMKLTKTSAQHIVDHMLELVGMVEYRKRRIGELSGGQQQRIMLARALAGNPELLLLDEPTSGIDYDASARIFELLGSLHASLGITILMVSHAIDQAVRHATRVACVNRGLCYYGSADEFRNSHIEARHLWYYAG